MVVRRNIHRDFQERLEIKLKQHAPRITVALKRGGSRQASILPEHKNKVALTAMGKRRIEEAESHAERCALGSNETNMRLVTDLRRA